MFKVYYLQMELSCILKVINGHVNQLIKPDSLVVQLMRLYLHVAVSQTTY